MDCKSMPYHHPGEFVGGHLKIIRLLGEGGFGETYLAKNDNKLQELCVVKWFKPRNVNLEQAQAIFEKEARALYLLGNKHDQIPQLIEHFSENDNFYLVQEYIKGKPLSEEIREGITQSEDYVCSFLVDILNILLFVHNNNHIHRDIKPSNIIRRDQDNKLCLIDFGMVKIIQKLSSDSINGGTPGYAAPEQTLGYATFASDLHAVGITAIQALTGVIPTDFQRDQKLDIIWPFPGISVSWKLESILNKLTRYHCNERYKSSQEVLKEILVRNNYSQTFLLRIRHLQELTSNLYSIGVNFGLLNMSIKPLGIMSVGMITVGIMSVGMITERISFLVLGQSIPKHCLMSKNDNISCGEEIVSRESDGTLLREKELGVKAFSEADYKTAIKLLKEARQEQPNDPETLIYLNNAKLADNKQQFYTIAAAIPLGRGSSAGDVGREILRGVAQLQEEVNKKPTEIPLQVIIANDDNDPKKAEKIADSLGQQKNIIGVVGHYASEVTSASLPVYKKHQLVLISPTSSSRKISNISPLFFRVVSNTYHYTVPIFKYVEKQKLLDRVAIFYNKKSSFSQSTYEQFHNHLLAKNLKNVISFDLSNPKFNAEDALKKTTTVGAKILILFPDGQVNDDTFQNTLDVITANKNRYPMLGNSPLYTTNLLQKRRLAEGLKLSIPWHPLNSYNANFVTDARKLWQGEINWRTANGYDAAKTIITALNGNKAGLNRDQLKIHETLQNPYFKVEGVTGIIQFETSSSDRKHPPVELVEVVSSACSTYGYTFVPLDKKSLAPRCLTKQ